MKRGEVIDGRFTILDCVGSGGMGVVYRAEDGVTGADVAFKVLKPGNDGWRFVRETRIACSVEHPYIAGYVAHGETSEGVPYLALEWLDGEDLESRLTRGPLRVGEALEIVARIASALRALHEAGIVHRDVKPANIFLCDGRPDRCRLLDFGVARVLAPQPTGERTFTGMVVGTPLYMAPEQVVGNVLEPSADLHALGVVLFECVTGHAPFDGGSLPGIVVRIVTEIAPKLSSRGVAASCDVDELCSALLQKDPAARPTAAAVYDLVSALLCEQTLPSYSRRLTLSTHTQDWVARVSR